MRVMRRDWLTFCTTTYEIAVARTTTATMTATTGAVNRLLTKKNHPYGRDRDRDCERVERRLNFPEGLIARVLSVLKGVEASFDPDKPIVIFSRPT